MKAQADDPCRCTTRMRDSRDPNSPWVQCENRAEFLVAKNPEKHDPKDLMFLCASCKDRWVEMYGEGAAKIMPLWKEKG